jgi:hypothetical protein
MVGNALVLHTEDQISSEAQHLALGVREDDDNDIVLLDLQGEMPVGIWEAVAASLRKSRRGIRLVVCGQPAETTVLTGQWLSERLNRTVIVPHGYIVKGTAGVLFVHAGDNSGWVRYRPGKPPSWDAKRFPRPLWDAAATDFTPTSSAGVVEPLPGGVWIRDTRDIDLIRDHWQWLVTALPCQPEALAVVLGCPGTPPLPLDDIARFWRELDADNRRRVRFVHYGPVQTPRGETLGQTLADLLGAQIICFGGIPVGDPGNPQLHTVTVSGQLGWQVFARELSYSPRTRPTAPAVTPMVLTHRPPLAQSEALAPMVYWYANDAVIEVVQAGLWMRPKEVPRNADSVRAARPSAEFHTFIYDDATEARAVRMRTLAEDVIARLDPATRERSALLAASLAATALASGPVAAGGQITAEESVLASYPDQAPAAAEPAPSVITGLDAPVERLTVLAPEHVLQPGATPMSDAVTALTSRAEFMAQVGMAAAQHAAEPEPVARPAQAGGVVDQAPLLPAAAEPTAPIGPAPSPAPAHARPSLADEPAPDRAPAAAVAARPVAPARHADEPAAFLPPSVQAESAAFAPSVGQAGPAAFAPPVVQAGPVAFAPPAVQAEPAPRAAETRREPGPEIQRAPAPEANRAAAGAGDVRTPRFQPVPDPAASALLSGRGLGEERAWLRRALSREFDAVASSVSRVLSEHPGLQGGDPNTEVLSDAVAVRLYLSPQGAAIDAGLRTARKGPHVPFARCVAAGLTRLPSHRGATVFAASPSRDEWKLLSKRNLVTEWGFLNALTAPSPDLAGDVDVLVWAMTARRTRLLEPAGDQHVDDRVLFMPGTSFKVLDIVEPGPRGRGQVLIRELSANEIDDHGRVDADRISFDELAVASLRRCAERWSEQEPASVVGPAAVGRFGSLPGID